MCLKKEFYEILNFFSSNRFSIAGVNFHSRAMRVNICRRCSLWYTFILRAVVWIYHPVKKPVSFEGNSNSKTYMTLTNSVPVIHVSILDLKVWKFSIEVNGNPLFFLCLNSQICLNFLYNINFN